MNGRLYRLARDLHLCLGLFISPFVLLFAASVPFLVHARLANRGQGSARTRIVADLPLPPNLDQLSGRERITALEPALRQAGVQGEVGWIDYSAQENRLTIPVTVPGRATTVRIDVAQCEAAIEERDTGLADALILLHKSPGPHLTAIRMNWFPMRVWSWFADATACLLLFITAGGLYLWYALRADRRAGLLVLLTGALSFFGMVYAIVH
ncbi:MAG: PepSY-associated TM helix domain-containing protein [Solirubrobacterales bacterium]